MENARELDDVLDGMRFAMVGTADGHQWKSTVRVLEVDVNQGEWWDGPSGRIGQLITVASAAVGHHVRSDKTGRDSVRGGCEPPGPTSPGPR